MLNFINDTIIRQLEGAFALVLVFDQQFGMMWWVVFSVLLLLGCNARPVAQTIANNSRPVIGMLVQPTGATEPSFAPYGNGYLPASYVKWVESAGARVVPIPWTLNTEELEEVFFQLNGLLLPGGNTAMPYSQYYNNSFILYQLALKANSMGDVFPIWGTCLGFEQLALLTSQNATILSNFSAENNTWPLHFTEYTVSSKLFGPAAKLNPSIIETFSTQPITENLHHFGVSPASYADSAELSSFYNILSTNYDTEGREFISSWEAKHMPIFGTQFHPERNAFTAAVQAMQYLANVFVSYAQQSTHRFDDEGMLIYNFPVIYTASINPFYEQTYIFNYTTR